MTSYTKKVIQLLRARIQRLGAPAHIIETTTCETLFNLFKMSKRMSAAGLRTRFQEAETALLVERARGRVLDVGCGIGKLAYSLACAKPELAVLGIDIDAEKIELAREVAEMGGLKNLAYEVDNMFELKHPGPFETIVALQTLGDVFEHSGPDAVQSILKGLFARLAPGGVLLVADATPVREFLGKRFALDEPVDVRPLISVRGERVDRLHLFGVAVRA